MSANHRAILAGEVEGELIPVLAIARGIIEAHGGRIWIESAPVQGAVFTFALPR